VTEQVIAITKCVSWALMPQKCISGWASTPDQGSETWKEELYWPLFPLSVMYVQFRLLI